MANTRILQRSFAGGEIAPEMYGRIDDVKYQSGLAKSLNFITKAQGPAENRPGTAFVRKVKDSTKVCKVTWPTLTRRTNALRKGSILRRNVTQR